MPQRDIEEIRSETLRLGADFRTHALVEEVRGDAGEFPCDVVSRGAVFSTMPRWGMVAFPASTGGRAR